MGSAFRGVSKLFRGAFKTEPPAIDPPGVPPGSITIPDVSGLTTALGGKADLASTPTCYWATLSNLSSDPPTVNASKNLLGGTPVWSRVSDGRYQLSNTGAFPQDRTYCFPVLFSGEALFVAWEWLSNDHLHVRVYDLLGSGFDPTTIQVKVEVHPV